MRITRRGGPPETPDEIAATAELRAGIARGAAPPETGYVGSHVYLGDDWSVDRQFAVEHDDETLGLHVELEVAMDVEHDPLRPVCRRVTVARMDGEPVRRDDLRRLPLHDYLELAVTTAQFQLAPGVVMYDEPPPADQAVARAQLQRARRGFTDERLALAAQLYRDGIAQGLPPTVYVARSINASRSTASRLLAEARKRRLLGPAIPRRAGEAT